MEDIKLIKEKTYELKQYANEIVQDLEKRLAEERKENSDSYNSLNIEMKEKEAMLVEKNGVINGQGIRIENLENKIRNIYGIIDSAKKICEEVE